MHSCSAGGRAKGLEGLVPAMTALPWTAARRMLQPRQAALADASIASAQSDLNRSDSAEGWPIVDLFLAPHCE